MCEALDPVVLAGVVVPVHGAAARVEAHSELHLAADVERLGQVQRKREPVCLRLTRVYEIRRHLQRQEITK